jgi:hypothetical protein
VATHVNRNGRYDRRRHHFFDLCLVLPVVAKIVGVGELIARPPREIAQVDSPGIIGMLGAARVAQAVVLAPEVEAMRVPVLPAHHHLKDMMQLGQGRVASHQHAPTDLRADA